MIEYENETKYENKHGKKIYFSDVECDQFFYDKDGWLCLKINTTKIFTIANEKGRLHVFESAIYEDVEIKSICKKVKKISVETI